MNITFADLPQFEVLEIIRQDSVTKFSGVIKNTTLSKAKPNRVVTICANQNLFIQGRFSEVDSETCHAVIDVVESESLENITSEKNYPLVDGYWGRLMQLVSDTSIIWKRVKFEPSDGVFRRPDGTTEIVKEGWEHEHCEICSQRISQYESDGNPYGYINQGKVWLCESCYQEYVEKKSLDFIYLDQMF